MTKKGCSSSFGSMTYVWRRRESNPRYVPTRFEASSELRSDAFARVQSVATSPVCLVSTRQALPAPARRASERLGHDDGGTLFNKTYRHLYPSEVTQAVGLIDALMLAARVKASANVGLGMDTANVE